MNPKRVLVVGSHFDDIELGCGGSLAKWNSQGIATFGLVVSRSGYKNESGLSVRSNETARSEGLEASRLLGYKLVEGGLDTLHLEATDRLNVLILNAVNDIKPDLILTHWSGDIHLDHKKVCDSVLHSAKRVPNVLGYQANRFVGNRPFDARVFIDIGGHLDTKISAISAHVSEVSRTNGAWIDWTRIQASRYGIECGVDHAEAFEVLRLRF